MTTNAERVYREFGQSLWYDNLERGLLRSGAFRSLVESGVRGCTSNPTSFVSTRFVPGANIRSFGVCRTICSKTASDRSTNWSGSGKSTWTARKLNRRC